MFGLKFSAAAMWLVMDTQDNKLPAPANKHTGYQAVGFRNNFYAKGCVLRLFVAL